MTALKQKRKKKLRHNEYYDTQEIFDDLYAKSLKAHKFKNLIDIIKRKENIELAYRNIKRNKGSRTEGTNKTTIVDLSKECSANIIRYIQDRIDNFKPHPVRRVEIPKGDGKIRPLGIPSMEDRLVQQCIYQILEPICEAKFYKHSYGFRPNRGTNHAVARTVFLINQSQLHYAVDIDIKGFFDNIDHGKLLKQIWNMGIRDKNLLSIISKMLRAKINGIGIPNKGTPQGGIISPLLSNIVLNELDWWISSQWETQPSKHSYCKLNKYNALKKTNLKECYIVRYADDFKILCRDYKSAQKIFIATRKWLKERLGLEINMQKSKVLNLRKNYSNFLGFKLKAISKRKSHICKTHVSNKAKKNIVTKIKNAVKKLQKNPYEVNKYNSIILGMHNYYRIATHVNIDFSEIAYKISRTIYNRLKYISSDKGRKSKSFEKFYGKYNFKTYYIGKRALFPIAGIRTKPPLNFSQDICNYTAEGRKKIHNKLKQINKNLLRILMDNPIKGQSIEYNDNRISLYVAQKGVCGITKQSLEIGKMECHHKTPKNKGGTDEYKNLILINESVHKLIHAVSEETIGKYKNSLKLGAKEIKKINLLRRKVGNCIIEL